MEKKLSMKRKLLKYCELKNISKNEFYLKAGLSNGFLDKDRGFNTDNLVKILTAFPDIDFKWLLFSDDDEPSFASAEITHNNVRGDLLGNGAVKNDTTLQIHLSESVRDLSNSNLVNSETIKQQSDQIGELIKYITSK